MIRNALQKDDIPYGNDWDSAAETAAYGDAADRSRPWRSAIRDHIASQIAALRPRARVLELGSGPGLLAERVLQRCPDLERYTLLDFSEPMLALSRERLSALPAASLAVASFVRASFKSDDWPRCAGGPFDCVVSMQAVHELRNKRHAPGLYAQVHGTLTVPGLVLICDHTPFDDSAKSTALYMTREEQQHALTSAGFTGVHVELEANGLILYAGSKES